MGAASLRSICMRTATALTLALVISAVAATVSGAVEASERQRLGDTASVFLGGGPHLALDPGGDALAVTKVRGRLAYRRARPGELFGPARLLPGASRAQDPVVAIDRRGAAVIAWLQDDGTRPRRPRDRVDPCCDRVTVTVAQPGRRPRAGRTLSAPGGSASDNIHVAIDGARVAVVWSQGGEDWLVTGTTDGSFGEPRGLGREDSRQHRFPVVAALQDGVARVLMATEQRGRMDLAQVTAPAEGALRERTVARGLGNLSFLEVRVAAAGRGRLAFVASRGDSATRLTLVTRRDSRSRFRRRLLEVPLGAQAGLADVAMSSTGRGLLAHAGAPGTIVVRRLLADGRVGRRHTVPLGTPRRPYGTTDVRVTVAPDGSGVLTAWGQSREGWTRPVAWRIDADGRPRRRTTLAPAVREFTPPEGVTATLDRRGRARVAWRRNGSVFAVRLR